MFQAIFLSIFSSCRGFTHRRGDCFSLVVIEGGQLFIWTRADKSHWSTFGHKGIERKSSISTESDVGCDVFSGEENNTYNLFQIWKSYTVPLRFAQTTQTFNGIAISELRHRRPLTRWKSSQQMAKAKEDIKQTLVSLQCAGETEETPTPDQTPCDQVTGNQPCATTLRAKIAQSATLWKYERIQSGTCF